MPSMGDKWLRSTIYVYFPLPKTNSVMICVYITVYPQVISIISYDLQIYKEISH